MRPFRPFALAACLLFGVLITPMSASAAPVPSSDPVLIGAGLKGFDNVGTDSAATLGCLQAAGFTFDVLNITGTTWINEYNAAIGLGMSVVMFQGYDPDSWADPSNGTTRGEIAATKAASVNYPPGAQIYLNLEDNIQPGTTRTGLIQWIENWAKAIKAKGFAAGVYVGVPQLLTVADLQNSLPDVSTFWRSASSSAPQAPQGFVMRQASIDQPACGTTIDINSAGTDLTGAGLRGQGVGAPNVTPATPGNYGGLTPARLLDTGANTPVGPRQTVTFRPTGVAGVPAAGVSSVAINVTAISPTAAGYITAYPSGMARPAVSSLQFSTGESIAGLVIARLGPDGKATLYNGSAGTVRLLVDVQGYYLDGSPAAGGAFGSVDAARLLDTGAGTPVTKRQSVNLKVTGVAGVPISGVSAVAINITAISPTAAGYITAWSAAEARPAVSSLQFGAGTSRAVLALVPVSAAGEISLYNGSQGNVRLLADIQGYYLAGAAAAAGAFTPLTPARVLDTGSAVQIGARQSVSVQLAGVAGIPPNGITAAAVNVTAITPTAAGYITTYPSGITRPAVSSVQFSKGQSIADLVIAQVGADGKIVLYNGSSGSVRLLVDVQGFVRA